MENLQNLMNQTSSWSDKTFDHGNFNRLRCIPISYHLQKEAKELTESIQKFFVEPDENYLKNFVAVKKEFADCLILIVDAACHFGLNADELLTVAFNKLEENKLREWGEPDEHGVIEHIRKA